MSGKGAGGDGERWGFDARESDELGGRPRLTRRYYLTHISKTDTYWILKLRQMQKKIVSLYSIRLNSSSSRCRGIGNTVAQKLRRSRNMTKRTSRQYSNISRNQEKFTSNGTRRKC